MVEKIPRKFYKFYFIVVLCNCARPASCIPTPIEPSTSKPTGNRVRCITAFGRLLSEIMFILTWMHHRTTSGYLQNRDYLTHSVSNPGDLRWPIAEGLMVLQE